MPFPVFYILFRLKFMPLTALDLDRLATLSRLALTPGERDTMCVQLNDFFGMVEQIQAIDTCGVVPLSHPVDVQGDIALRLRCDLVTETDQRQANQRNAPALENGLFLVPKVIE